VPGDPTWPPARSLSSLQEPSLPQGARHFEHVRVLPLRDLRTPPELCPLWLSRHSRVCIRDVKEAFSVRPRFPGSFEYLVLDVQDSEEQNLIRLFPRFFWQIICRNPVLMYLYRFRAQHFINTALSRGGRVLVHCNGTILPRFN
jgi:hypothetical protein